MTQDGLISFQDATLGADIYEYIEYNYIVFSRTPNISARISAHISEEFTARNLHLTSPGPSYVHLSSPQRRAGHSYSQEINIYTGHQVTAACRTYLGVDRRYMGGIYTNYTN